MRSVRRREQLSGWEGASSCAVLSAPAAPTLAASAGTALSPAGPGGIRGGFTGGRWQSPGECGQGGRWAPSLHVLAAGMAGAARDALSHTASVLGVPTWGRVPSGSMWG